MHCWQWILGDGINFVIIAPLPVWRYNLHPSRETLIVECRAFQCVPFSPKYLKVALHWSVTILYPVPGCSPKYLGVAWLNVPPSNIRFWDELNYKSFHGEWWKQYSYSSVSPDDRKQHIVACTLPPASVVLFKLTIRCSQKSVNISLLQWWSQFWTPATLSMN